LGPVLGGFLSNPGAFSQDTLLPNELESHFPFLLPNVVAAALSLVSLISVAAFVEDEGTHTASESKHSKTTTSGLGENQPLLPKKDIDNYNANIGHRHGVLEVLKIIWKKKNTRLHLLAYWSFSFVVVCIDEALPLFLIGRLSGPGLSPMQIGWILSAAGLLVVMSRTIALDRIMSEEEGLGIYPSLRISAIIGNVPSVLIPFMLVMNGGTYQELNSAATATAAPGQGTNILPGTILGESLGSEGGLSWEAFLFLAVLLGCIRIFVAVYFQLIGVATGRTVEPNYRNETSRIMTLGALCSRAVAPAVAGFFVYLFMSPVTSFYGASAALWLVIGLLFGLGAAIYSFQIHQPEETLKKSVMISERHSQYLHKRKSSADIFKKLWEVQNSTPGAKVKRMAQNSLALLKMSSSGRELKQLIVLNSASFSKLILPFCINFRPSPSG
jgi:hypothetical protein